MHFPVSRTLLLAVLILPLSQLPAADAPKAGDAKAKKTLRQRVLDGELDGLLTNQTFKATAEQMAEAMSADNAANKNEPLQFPKGNGLRIVTTGHSWVAPARKTLPEIAKAAGLDGHRQRSHTSGGSTGSANSIWLTEFGKFPGKPKTFILLPAIATGQWDVMTWGAFYGDTPENYSQWIDVCLKANPKMIFYIQDGWPVIRPDAKDQDPKVQLKNFDDQLADMQPRIFKTLYEALNQKYPGKVHIIPAGPAVVTMLHHYYAGELPGFDCVSENFGGKKGIYRDGGHLSAGSGMEWLVGYMYYGTLYQKSPELLKDFRAPGVDPTVDKLMRAAAWKAITTSPFTELTDKNSNGIADQAETKQAAK